MKNFKEFTGFYTFFFLSSLLLLMLYRTAFFLDNPALILTDYPQIIYALFFSIVFAFYFTALLIYDFQMNKMLIFTSGLSIIFSLQNIKMNIILKNISDESASILQNISGIASIILILIAIYYNAGIKRKATDKKVKRDSTQNEKSDDFFI